jgi:hypothetical protein
MPQWAPSWVGDLLASPILVDERDILMDRRKADLALKAPQPKPPEDGVTELMRRMDAALEKHGAASLPGQSLAPGSPDLPHPEQAAAEIAAQAGPPMPRRPPCRPHAARPRCRPVPMSPHPVVGPDGLLHAPDEQPSPTPQPTPQPLPGAIA